MEAWKTIAERKQRQRQDRLPQEWIISSRPAPDRNNILDVPLTCGLLSKVEINITETSDATALLDALATKKVSSVDVVTAFSKRAAVAHQLVRMSR